MPVAARTLADLLDALDPHGEPWPGPLDARAVVAIAGTAESRAQRGRRGAARDGRRDRPLVEPTPAGDWPFIHPMVTPDEWPPDAVVWVPDLHLAFENTQTNSTRLVTTQPLYVLQVWLDALSRRP